MRFKTFFEMSIRGGNLDNAARRYAEVYKSKWYQSDIIANLDEYDVCKTGEVYTLWFSDQLVFFASVKEKLLGYEVDDVFTSPEYRGKNIFSKMLLFFKTREHMNTLLLGKVHSDDTINLLKAGGFKLFKKHWINRNGDTRDFKSDNVDDFYGAGDWQLVLENFDDFSDYPRYNGSGYIKESYDVLLQIFDLNEVL